MGIFKNMFSNNSNQPVSDPYFDVIYNYFSNDDFDTDGKGAINISSSIYAVTNKIANTIASKPILSTNNYMAKLLNSKVNNSMNSFDFKRGLIMNALIYGDAFGLIQTSDNGTISDIDLLPTYAVTVVKGPSGLSYRYNNDQTYTDDQIIHIKINTLNGLTGTSPLIALKQELKLNRASNKMLEKFYTDTCINKVLLQVDDKLSSDDKAKLKQAFQKNMGVDSSNGSIISDNSIKITPFNSTNVNGDILKQTKQNDYFSKKIASVYGVPASILGVVNPHSNGSDVSNEFRQDLEPYIHALTSELESKLTGSYVIDNPIQVTSATDIANLSKAGAISQADARDLLGLNN